MQRRLEGGKNETKKRTVSSCMVSYFYAYSYWAGHVSWLVVLECMSPQGFEPRSIGFYMRSRITSRSEADRTIQVMLRAHLIEVIARRYKRFMIATSMGWWIRYKINACLPHQHNTLFSFRFNQTYFLLPCGYNH